MKIFQLQIDDDRYSIRSLMFLEAANERRARLRAEEILEQSPHYQGVEVYEDDALVFAVGSRSGSSALPEIGG